MKRCMALCAFGFFVPGILFAEEAGREQEQVLPPVVVTATRIRDAEEEVIRVPGKVTVITAREIEKLGAKTVQEVLQYQGGVVLYDQIGNEFQSTVDLRGFNGQPVSATSVFLDGVRVNEPDFNGTNFELIPLEDVERIEILPGTATVFGRNALGGVINIITKRGRKDRLHWALETGGGTFGQQRHVLSADGPLPLPDFDYYVGVTRQLTEGFRDATGGRITRVFSKLGYRPAEGTDADLAFIHVDDHLKQAGALPPSLLRINRRGNFTPGDFSDSDLDLVSLNLRQKLPGDLSLALNGFVRDNDQESFVNFASGNSRLQTDVRAGGGTAQLTHDGSLLGRKNLFHLGVEYNRNRFSSENRGSFFGFPFVSKKTTREDVVGFYVSESLDLLPSLVLSGGLRYDWDRLDFADKIDSSLSGKKAFHRVNPKTGVVFLPTQALSFSFSYSEGIRIPTVEEIFALGPFGSNPGLSPMRSRNYELGTKVRVAGWLDASLTMFYMPVRDEILFVVTDPSAFTGRNENIERTLRRGVEFSLKGRYAETLDGFLNYTLTKATFETDVFLFSGQVQKGDDLPLVPRHRIGAGASYHALKNLTFSLFGTYVGRQFLLNDEPNTFKRLADYFVLNSRAEYRRGGVTGYVTINNMTNRKYATSGILSGERFLVPAPPVNVFAGLSFRY